MYLLYVGLTHKKAPVELREKIHFSQDELDGALKALKQEKSILENVIVSTCNRTELYLVVDQLHTGRYFSKMFLAKWFQIDVKEIEPYLVYYEEEDMLRHVLRVAVGLESKIIGETQILGQLKQAFDQAMAINTTGMLLHYIFRQVVTFSKLMHATYRINDRPASVSLTAMQLAEELSGQFENQIVAVVGAGHMAKLLLKYLIDKPFNRLKVYNRTVETAQELCELENMTAHTLAEMDTTLSESDVIFSAVTAPTFVIKPEMVKENALVFDLGVPRTVHPSEAIRLYDIDDLTNTLDQYHTERQFIAEHIQNDIEEEICKYQEWKKQLGIVPLIKELRERSLKAQELALESLLKKIPHLTAREQKQVEKHMKSIVNQILKEPILQLKEMSIGDNSIYDIALVSKIFGLTQQKEDEDAH